MIFEDLGTAKAPLSRLAGMRGASLCDRVAGPAVGSHHVGMRKSADDLLADLLVRVVREQRRRRDWGFEEPSGLPREPADGVEQMVEQEA